ncbi:hypothetical protein E4U14_008121 [Claviceps sp. LM454 group G7]|nr:hypothetical protein E4U14_008121 [Claviceps sp. LM454 group G7]
MFADSDKFHHLFGCRLRDPNGNSHEGSDILTFQNGAREEHNVVLSVLDGRCSEPACTSSSLLKPANARLQRSSSSPYFVPVIRSSRTLSQRKPAGTVPSVPYPPLSSLHFELNGHTYSVQEKMAYPRVTTHFGCWCQVAVTFLIKTNGQVAIPVFYKVKQRFPSPTELADPRNAQGLLSMIRHLNRLKQIQKYTESGTTMHVMILLSLETRLA